MKGGAKDMSGFHFALRIRKCTLENKDESITECAAQNAVDDYVDNAII